MLQYKNTGCLIVMLILMGSCSNMHFTKTPIRHKDTLTQASYADQLFMTGEKLKLKGKHKEAIQKFRTFLTMEPDNATAYYEIARQFNTLKIADSALYYARKANSRDSSNKWIRQFYARTLATNKKYNDAAQVFHQLSNDYPHSSQFMYQEALMRSYAEDYDKALHLFDRLEKREGINEEWVYEKQRIYLKRNQIDSAAGEIQKLIHQYPDNRRYYALLAKVYANHDQASKAIKIYKDLLKKQPGNPQAQVALGILYKQIDSSTQFKSYIQKAFRNPQFGLEKKIRFIYPFLKYVKLNREEQSDALWLCKLLTEVYNKDARSYALYGDMYFQCQETDSALVQYKKALHYPKSRYEVWNQIMFIYAKRGNADSLLSYSRLAANQYPDNARARYFNGMALFFKGENKNAASELKEALKLGINNRDLKRHIYVSLQKAYLLLNNRKAAKKYKKLANQIRIEVKEDQKHPEKRNKN